MRFGGQIWILLKERSSWRKISDPALKEYGKMQMNIQLKVASGQNPDNDEVQRFNQLSSLLFADERTSSYILSQMRMQKLTADILQIIGTAAELDENLPM